MYKFNERWSFYLNTAIWNVIKSYNSKGEMDLETIAIEEKLDPEVFELLQKQFDNQLKADPTQWV